MKPRDLLLLFLLAAMWGGSFLFIRIAAPVLGPVVLTACRVTLAGLSLLLYARLTGQRLGLRPLWWKFGILGGLNAAIPFCLIATAELNLTASFGAILNATTPLFTALVAAVWLKDALTPRKIAGLVLGLVGVAVVVGWSPLEINGVILLSVGISLLAALFYALGAVYSRIGFKNVPTLTLATGQQLSAATILFVPAVALSPSAHQPSPLVIGCVLALALTSTSLGYLIYFRLMNTVGPTSTTSVTFLVPVFSLIWGTLFLGEPVGLGLIVGFVIILSGLGLVTGLRFNFYQPHPVLKQPQ